MLKWLRNPEYYLIDKTFNSKNIIKILECEKYRDKASELECICVLPTLKKMGPIHLAEKFLVNDHLVDVII